MDAQILGLLRFLVVLPKELIGAAEHRLIKRAYRHPGKVIAPVALPRLQVSNVDSNTILFQYFVKFRRRWLTGGLYYVVTTVPAGFSLAA
jgi:hypothetical protein